MKPPDHIELLGVLFAVWGGLTIVIGLSTLALGLGASALALAPDAIGAVASWLTAAIFVSLALIGVAWGAVHVAVGGGLRVHRPRARLAALMLAVVDLLILPYGTALGGYALWALLGESRRRVFEEPHSPGG